MGGSGYKEESPVGTVRGSGKPTSFGRPRVKQTTLGKRTMCRPHPTRGEGARRLLASRSESMHRAVATDFKLRGPHYWCGNFSRRDVVPTPMETAPQLGAP